MRVAVVSHTYVVEANRGKLEALARLPGLQMLLVIPRAWESRDVGHRLRAYAAHQGPLAVTVLRAWSFGSGSLITYAPVALFRTLRHFRPDFVHLEEEPWSFAALELSLICWALGIPFTFFTWENTNRRVPPPFKLVRRWVLRRALAAVAGNAEAKTILERGGFRKAVTVLPQLGVDTMIFRPVARDAVLQGKVIGFVGRLVPQKGLLVLLDAIARLPADVRLLVVGSGPLKIHLLRKAQALGVDGRVDVQERVAHHEVPRYLKRMNVVVLPSLTTPGWKEQFGHVLIEAMACGVPVIGSDSGAIPEVIGDAGIVVREGDVAALTSALERVISIPALRRDLSNRGRARVMSSYTDNLVARRLAAFWRALPVDA